jgi:hypothetical protein
MAKFGESFLAQLGSPAMSQSLFGLGSAIGGIPGQMKERRKQQELNQLMQQGQKAMASGDAAALASIGQQLAARGYQKEAQQLTQASREASEKAKRVSAGQALLSGVPSRMRQGAGTLAEQGLIEQAMEAQGLAQARQIDKGKQALATFASARGMQMSDPKAREGFFRIAKAYEVPIDQANAIYENFTQASGDRTTKGEVVIRDSQGNLFTRASQYDEQGRGREVILPFPGSPEKPVGNLTIVSGTTGAGAFDKPEIRLEEEFSGLRIEAINALPSLERSFKNAERSLELLEQINTGGFTTSIVRSAQNLFGETPANEAAFQTLAGKNVLQGLEAFTGAISNQERTYLEGLYQSLEKSNFANKAILKLFMEEYKDAIESAQLRADSTSFEDYNTKQKQRRAKKQKQQQEETTFDFNNLPTN